MVDELHSSEVRSGTPRMLSGSKDSHPKVTRSRNLKKTRYSLDLFAILWVVFGQSLGEDSEFILVEHQFSHLESSPTFTTSPFLPCNDRTAPGCKMMP